MSDSFTVNITSEGEATVLSLVGEFDLGGVSTFADAMAVVDPSAQRVVIDLSGLTFVGSTGLGCFVRSQKELEERGARLALRSPSNAVRRLIDTVDLAASTEIID